MNGYYLPSRKRIQHSTARMYTYVSLVTGAGKTLPGYYHLKEAPHLSKVHKLSSSSSMDSNNPASFNHRKERLSTGRTYHFVDQLPDTFHSQSTTLLCIHGFPDLW